MFRLMLVLLIILVAVTGCAIPTSPLSVVLATPANGSTTQSLSPVMTWVSLGAYTYHLQVATDTGFQNPLVDERNLTQIVYSVPYGRLSGSTTYFWRVRASYKGETGHWATAWYFITPGGSPTPPPGATGTINVATAMDGVPWFGSISYTLSGPTTVSGTSTPQAFAGLPVGSYTLTYNYGGPSGAAFGSITPSSTQTLTEGSNILFNLHLRGQAASGIEVFALLDGAPWSGMVNYTINGPGIATGFAVPKTFANISPGTYTLVYTSGGPPGATLSAISPSATEILGPGKTTSFTLIFRSAVSGSNVQTNATLNGAPWTGSVNYTLRHYTVSGPVEDQEYSVPRSAGGLPAGNMQLTYNSGGPSGATLSGITPSAQQTVTPGGTVYFTMNFVHQQPSYGRILVNATHDGEPWQVAIGSGGISYSIIGPDTHTGSNVPSTYDGQPTGTYTLSFNSGGPPGSVLTSVSPSATQTLTPGGTISYTLNFHGQARGTVHVTATLNGEPWSGSVGYVVSGPYMQSGGYAPQSFSNAATGTYSVSYSSGGPPSCVFEDVTPASQILPAGGSISFNIKFRYQGGVLPGPLVQ